MSSKTQENYLICAKHLLNKIKNLHKHSMLCFLSSEKNVLTQAKSLTVEMTEGNADHSDGPRMMYTKFSETVIVLEVVDNKCHVVLPLFFLWDLRINTVGYIYVLKIVAISWIDEVHSRMPYVFHQDSATSHRIHITQEWVGKSFQLHGTKFVSSKLTNGPIPWTAMLGVLSKGRIINIFIIPHSFIKICMPRWWAKLIRTI